jgi:CBS domain-containing protein/ribosome-associated translation inhibitor RaiA
MASLRSFSIPAKQDADYCYNCYDFANATFKIIDEKSSGVVMKVSEIMVSEVLTLGSEDTIGKAYSMMESKRISQVPVVDNDRKYSGMIFAKQLISSSAQPTSKLKSFVVNTTTAAPDIDVEKAAQLIIGSGNRAIPVVEKGKLVGIISETDLIQTADFGHATVDEIMTGAIVIEEETSIADALSKMRRYNISRLPVIDTEGILRGIVNILDIGKIVAVAPRERTSQSAGISGGTSNLRDIKVKDIMRRATSAERGTRLSTITNIFRRNDELVIVGGGRPMGIVTPKDALELVLPKKKSAPTIHMAHIENGEDKAEIQEQLERFLKKIQGKIGDVRSVIVYVDKHKTRKYSIRTRLITARGVIDAKAVGYDPISASKELVGRLERRVKSEHSQKIQDRRHRDSARRA